MDAIKLLKDDHKTVNELFRRFERSGDEAYETKREVVARIVEELSVHAAIEEQVLYPAIRAEVPSTETMTLEALEEHHIVKWTLSELDGMDPHDERFDAKVTVLIESVRHHVEEEEGDLFPKVRDGLSRKRLDQLGDELRQAKKVAPTRPHPRLPDAPPLNVLTGAAGIADRVSEKVMNTARSALDFANPLSSSDDEPAKVTQVKTKASKAVKATKKTGAAAAKKASKATAKVSKATKAPARKAPSKRTSTAAAKTTAKRTAKKATRTATKTATKAKATTVRKAKAATRTAKTAASNGSRTASNGARTAKRTTKKATKRARATAAR
jgi:hemerythrin superfamily protein